MEFTNPGKVLYPASGFTKGEVIKYYLDVSRWILPHLKNRPVTLKRFPDGVGGEAFYEKDAPGFTPAWVRTHPVPRREGGEPIHYILVNDPRTLAWCANLATIEFHPFLHRVPAIDVPTHLALDLDPGEGADILTCAEVAFLVKGVLDAVNLASFPKVSGSKGIQIYVPLNTATNYDATQAFARTLAELLHQRHPKLVVSEMARSLRANRVFIDWSQNSDFKTTVGVYSLRAKRDEPFVSMPVTWSELDRARKRGRAEPLYFGPDAARARLKRHGDVFAPVLKLKQRLPAEFAAIPATSKRRTPRALQAYEAKRNFDQTAEPAPELPRRSAQGSRRRFVVQKHAASHLHYDFRLEMANTLKSWAVPKGLPNSPGERHSAFATEDHPLDYLNFEGIIPEGQYGGGTVMVWDIGTYDVIEGNYWRGFLRVFLRGKKLKGEWTLTRVADENEKVRWVLEKADATAKRMSEKPDDASALSGRTMAEIGAARDAVWQSNREETGDLPPTHAPRNRHRSAAEIRAELPTRARPAKPATRTRARVRHKGSKGGATPHVGHPLDDESVGPAARNVRGTKKVGTRSRAAKPAPPAPEFVPPMLARAVEVPPEGDDWTYEVKWDGYRALAVKHGESVRLLSRKNKSLAADFPAVVSAVREIKASSAVLDGEIVALDEHGRPQFQALQHRASAPGEIVYYAFDLLELDGEDLKRRPLEERKAKLADIVQDTAVRFSASLPGTPAQIIAEASQLGLEGIIAKRSQSPYESGERSGAWQKLKLSPEQEFVIGGFKPGKPLESLLVGYYDDGKLFFAGKVRQGLNPRLRAELGQLLGPLATDGCPFANLPNSKKSHFGEGVTPEQMKELRWVKPKLVAQVSFTEWTRGGNLRHATYLGLRDDKDPREVRREPVAGKP